MLPMSSDDLLTGSGPCRPICCASKPVQVLLWVHFQTHDIILTLILMAGWQSKRLLVDLPQYPDFQST